MGPPILILANVGATTESFPLICQNKNCCLIQKEVEFYRIFSYISTMKTEKEKIARISQ